MTKVTELYVEIEEEDSHIELQNKVNRFLSYVKEDGSELIDIKYAVSDNKYSAMIIYKDFVEEEEYTETLTTVNPDISKTPESLKQ